MKRLQSLLPHLRTLAMVAVTLFAAWQAVDSTIKTAEQRGFDKGYAKATALAKEREVAFAGGMRYTLTNIPLGLEVKDNGRISVVRYHYPTGVEHLATYPKLIYTVHDGPPTFGANGYEVKVDGTVTQIGNGGTHIYLADYPNNDLRIDGRINPGEVSGIAKAIKKKDPGFSGGFLNATVTASGNEIFRHWIESPRMQWSIGDSIVTGI